MSNSLRGFWNNKEEEKSKPLYGKRITYKPKRKKKGKRKKQEPNQFPSDKGGFYSSEDWRRLRYRVLKNNDGCCMLCGRNKKEHGVVLHVDHIKPRSKYPKLEFQYENLQILCADCNVGKSNKDETDWRPDKVGDTEREILSEALKRI